MSAPTTACSFNLSIWGTIHLSCIYSQETGARSPSTQSNPPQQCVCPDRDCSFTCSSSSAHWHPASRETPTQGMGRVTMLTPGPQHCSPEHTMGTHIILTPSLSSWLISASTAFMSRFLVISSKAFSGIISIKKRKRSNLQQLQFLSSPRKARQSAEMLPEQVGHRSPPSPVSDRSLQSSRHGQGAPRPAQAGHCSRAGTHAGAPRCSEQPGASARAPRTAPGGTGAPAPWGACRGPAPDTSG